jgi:hypothetical protein
MRSEIRNGETLITFRHTVLGFVPEEHKAGMNKGWAPDARTRLQTSEASRK